ERAPVVESTGVVHVDDVRALHARRGARLAEEALDDDGRRAELRGQHFDRDALVQRDVDRLVDGGHPPATDLARDLVLADENGPYGDLRLVLDRCHRWGSRARTRLSDRPPGSRLRAMETATIVQRSTRFSSAAPR